MASTRVRRLTTAVNHFPAPPLSPITSMHGWMWSFLHALIPLYNWCVHPLLCCMIPPPSPPLPLPLLSPIPFPLSLHETLSRYCYLCLCVWRKAKALCTYFCPKKTLNKENPKKNPLKKKKKSKRDWRKLSITFLSRKNKERERQKPIEPIEGSRLSDRGKPINKVGAFGASCGGGGVRLSFLLLCEQTSWWWVLIFTETLQRELRTYFSNHHHEPCKQNIISSLFCHATTPPIKNK